MLNRAAAEKLDAILTERIHWEGDLGDDCSAEWRGFGAHVELMSEAGDTEDGDEPLDHDTWYCCVWRANVPRTSDERTVFHSTEDDILPLTGDAARALCERIMRFEALIAWAR